MPEEIGFKVISLTQEPEAPENRPRYTEGENLVHETPQGQKIYLVLEPGKPSHFKAVDSNGVEYPTMLYRSPDPSVRHWRVCACFPDGDKCWWVPMAEE